MPGTLALILPVIMAFTLLARVVTPVLYYATPYKNFRKMPPACASEKGRPKAP